MLCSGRWLLAAAWLAALTGAASPSMGQPPRAPLRTESELAAARRLFADALRDEQDRRFDAALDEFRQVRDVRDTAPVEYRIGTCLEGLGRLAEAMAAYDAAIRLTEGDAAAADVAAGSRERLDALSKRVAHLVLTLSSRTPPGAEVLVDGRLRAAGDIILDPGSHRIEATATGAAPFQSDVALPEAGRVSLTVPLDPLPAPPAAPPATVEPRVATDSGSTARTTWGWVGVGAGSVLLAASVTSFVLRETDIRTANRDCPGGACLGRIDPEAQSATNRARIEGPIGFALGAAGVVGAGLGVYLLVSTPGRASSLSIAPTAWCGGAGIALRGLL